MLQLVIIADDLTGAIDTAAPFAALANGVAVATDARHLNQALRSGAAVVSVCTGTRDLPASDATERVAAVLAQIPRTVRLFKKIDSRLKGHLDAELSAFGNARFIVAPAIPDLGRHVVGGQLLGQGVAQPIAISAALGQARARATIPDAATHEDLCGVLATAPPDAVLVGARGLAQALAAEWRLQPRTEPLPLQHPLVVIVGSTDPITQDQVDHLLATRPDLHTVLAPSGELIPENVQAIAANQPDALLVQATPGQPRSPVDVGRRLAVGAMPLVRDAASLVLTGGATAEAVLHAKGCAVLRVHGEALPGIPLCVDNGQLIVTKSGGFGDIDALQRLSGGPTLSRVGQHG